jgi:AraC-like DNA-binding protein
MSASVQGVAALRRRLRPDLHLAEGTGPQGEACLLFRHQRHRLGPLALHTLELSGGGLTLASDERLCLVVPLAGEATLWPQAGRRRPALTADAGQSVVLVPPGRFRVRCDRLSVVLVTVPWQALADAAALLAGPEARAALQDQLGRCRQWRQGEGPARELLALLRQALPLLEAADAAQGGPAPLAARALAPWFLQTLALLLLLEPEQDTGLDAAADRERRFDALIAHIEANLHRGLSLPELSQRSGWSPRSLQYAFQRRFGCGPMQWVRRRRLEAAHQALRGADPSEPVARIARRCGYVNLSSFSRDILRTYGRTPSALRPGGLWPDAQ